MKRDFFLISSSYQRGEQNLPRLKPKPKGTQPVYSSRKTASACRCIWLQSDCLTGELHRLCLSFILGTKSTVWLEDAQWWISVPLMDLNNIHCSRNFFFFFDGHIFYLGCPLSAIAWRSLNKAHASEDTCWDAFWRAFGLPEPWRTKQELYKPHPSWRLQNNTAYTKGSLLGDGGGCLNGSH